MPALSGGRMLCTSRNDRSVAWSNENVIGVSDIFFLPFFVIVFTSSALFHSVKKGRSPLASRYRLASWSCVLFPEPSMPSTTISLPGSSCGCVSKSIASAVLLLVQAERDVALERFREALALPARPPDLGLRVGLRCECTFHRVVADPATKCLDALRMTAIQAVGEPQQRRPDVDDLASARREVHVTLVRALWRRLAVVPRDVRHDRDLLVTERL